MRIGDGCSPDADGAKVWLRRERAMCEILVDVHGGTTSACHKNEHRDLQSSIHIFRPTLPFSLSRASRR